ncbi:hypothetical protein [Bacillus sonorensis]|uniref:hypothetical protein n=1 Tax=Bacillus sonorensis TaxID=119858 RepID=UPI000989F9EE|nr:hypothetical protein [Bacillus sonorensis]
METKPILVFINTDDQGNIIDKVAGYNCIPDRPYQYFFMTYEKDAMINSTASLSDYEEWQRQSFGV